MTTVTLYKEDKDTKLGITFFRRDPQDGASGNSALVSRISPSGLAANELSVGERIMSVQGVSVEGPLHAARMLRESEGFMKIGKLPKRDDFDANLDRYQQMEQEAARNAMAQALPGQEPQRTPRTDAATPRGPGSGAMDAAAAKFSGGLRPINQPGGLSINIGGISEPTDVGAQLSARAQAVADDVASGFAQLSARAGNFFNKIGSGFNKLGEAMPTQGNQEYKAARIIQKGWRTYASRGHFHESRGAVLMLQSAARRKKAQAVVKYKSTLQNWAAICIQEGYRRHKLRQKAVALQAEKAKKDKTIGSKLVKSLSFTRRTRQSKAKVPPKPSMPEDITDDDLLSARGGNKTPLVASSAEPSPAGGETPSKQRRSLSFTRRKKAATSEAPSDAPITQKV